MDLNKVPRWALILIAMVGIGACGLVVSTARADLDNFKEIANEAKSASDSNSADIGDLKESVKDILVKQEVFRKEYREDRNKDAELLRNMEERIIRAVKS